MEGRCPGQDFRKLRVELHCCPHCRAEVEIFSDELKARCPGCGTMVLRENRPSCIEWCSSARQCLGEERWLRLNEVTKTGGNDNAGQENSEF